MSLHTVRRNIEYPNPDRSDRPDVAYFDGKLAAALDVDMLYAQGTNAARLAAAHQAGGGLLYFCTDTLACWYDDGANWRYVGPVRQDTDANRLAATHAQGRLWYTTDTNILWYDDGANWHQITVNPAAINQYGTHAARPAANTVPAGTLYFESDTGGAFRSDGANWAGPINPGAQLDYASILSLVTIAATTEATATTVVSGNSVTYDGSKVKITIYVPRFESGTSGIRMFGALTRDGAVVYDFNFGSSDQTAFGWPSAPGSACEEIIDVPAAGLHTYAFKAWAGTTNTIKMGGGVGASGTTNNPSAFIQVAKA